MQLLCQLFPNFYPLGSKQEGEAQVKKTHLKNKKLLYFHSALFSSRRLWLHIKQKL